MSRTKLLPVKDLVIDLHNFRTVAQKNELEATKAMISISPDYFWGLMESLLEDGYLPTENIIIIEDSAGGKQVREGNRRVASLKIMLGLIDLAELELPSKIVEQISKLPANWSKENSSIPCAIYKETEADVVDRIITHTHGKAQKAGRHNWGSVARARHNKTMNGASEPGLDLFEKYLVHGTNITQEQKIRWAGSYNVTVLDEAIKKIAQRLGAVSSPELAKLYPKVSHKKSLDEILYAIGIESLTFPAIRDSSDFAQRFGIPPMASSTGQNHTNNSLRVSTSGGTGKVNSPLGPGLGAGTQRANDPTTAQSGTGSSGGATTTHSGSGTSTGGKTSATATTDERSVKKALRALKLFGPSRAKVETLRKEILKLKLKDNPIAFCFLLRSMFEISAKAYCLDHASQPGGPTVAKADGSDRSLADVLRDIVTHLTQNKADKQMVKLLHGPLTEIQRHDGILSLTSMNQLVHNSSFTILSSDIPTLFSNIFPLLEQMNK